MGCWGMGMAQTDEFCEIYDKFMEDLYPLYSEKFKLKRGAKELIEKLLQGK